MADKNKTNGDTTEAQPATGQTPDANDQLAIDPKLGDTLGQPAADPPAPVDEPMLPKSRYDEANTRAQAAEEKAELLQQQMLMMTTAQQYNPQVQPQQSQQASTDPYDGFEDDDYVSVAAARKSQQAFATQIQQQVNQQIQVSGFQAGHPDYAEVVGTQNQLTGQFEMSPHLTTALTNNPAMTQLLKSQQHPLAAMQLAYQLATSEKAKVAKNQSQQTTTYQQQNARITASAQTAIMPGSAVGGSGEINNEAAASGWSDAEFAALDAKVMSGQLER